MSDVAKKIRIFLFSLLLCACSSKEQIEGKRISLLMTGSDILSSKLSSHDIIVSREEKNTSWTQNAFNAAHLQKNFVAAQNMQLYASFDAGKGASKKAPLLSVPVVDNQVVYVQDRKGTVSAFDLKTKKRLFKQKLTSSQSNDSSDDMNGVGLALKDSYLFALTGSGSVFALNKTNGNILWQQDLQIPLRVAPSVAGNILFIQTIDNKLLALDMKDGHQIWSYDISSEDTVLAGGASPAYDAQKEIVVTAFSNGELQAFNAKIGYSLWSNNLINTSFSSSSLVNAVKASPVIENDTVFAIGNNNKVMAVDLETGDILWTQPIGGVNTPFVEKTALFLISNDGKLWALDKETGNEIWSSDVLEGIKLEKRRDIYLSGPLMINSELLITASNGLVYTFDPKNGTKTGEFDIDEDLPFGPVVADQKLIFLTRNAELIVYH